MATERISQILPTVKCSDCGRDVQIRRLGDHLCPSSSKPPVPALPIIPQVKQEPHHPTKPISPLQSPDFPSPPSTTTSTTNKYSNYNNQERSTLNDKSGTLTPPYYYSGMAKDLMTKKPQQQLQQPASYLQNMNNNSSISSSSSSSSCSSNTSSNGEGVRGGGIGLYTDDLHNSSSSTITTSPTSPGKNSTSPAPLTSSNSSISLVSSSSYSSSSYRHHPNSSQTQVGSAPRYDGKRKQSLNNIHNQQQHHRSDNHGALDNLMQDLMNSMNDEIHNASEASITFPPTATDNFCCVCLEEFDYRDDVRNIGSKRYHKACFICRLCSLPFDHHSHGRGTPFEFEGKLYCERDYHVVKNRILCGSCDRVISPSITPIKALGKYYHPGHIKCYHCYLNIDERTGWKEYQGRVYCRQDFKSLFLPKCRACQKPVEKNAVSAADGKLKGKWHLECFGCHYCKSPFPENTFYVFGDLPYCKRHYHKLNGSLCKRCGDGIEGHCAFTPENWKFHPRCFTCEACHRRLDDEYYVANGRIYCEDDIRRQYHHQKNMNISKRKTQMYNI